MSRKFRTGIVVLLLASFLPLIAYSLYLNIAGGWWDKQLYQNETILFWFLGIVVLFVLSLLLGCWRGGEEGSKQEG